MDAIVCDLREQDVNYHSERELDPTSRPNRRQFDQRKVLTAVVRECLFAELEINPIYITSSSNMTASLRSDSTDSRDNPPPLLQSISMDSWSSCASNASSLNTDDHSEVTTQSTSDFVTITKSVVILHPSETSDAEVTLFLTIIPVEWTTCAQLAEYIATSTAVTKSHQRRQQMVKDMLFFKGFDSAQMSDVILSYVAAIVKGELADHSQQQTNSSSSRKITPTNFRGAHSLGRGMQTRLGVIPEDRLVVGSEVDDDVLLPPLSPALISSFYATNSINISNSIRPSSIEHLTVSTSPRSRGLTHSGSAGLSSVSVDSSVSGGGESGVQITNGTSTVKKRKQSPISASTTTAEKRISPIKSPEKMSKTTPSPPNKVDESGQITHEMEISTPSPPQQSAWSSALISAALMLEESDHSENE